VEQTRLVDFGGWLFENRGWVPVPLLVFEIVVSENKAYWIATGLLIMALGEVIRLWGVAHIGPISRTRKDENGPLVSSGPYQWSRNPLYVGNVLMHAGLAALTGQAWVVGIVGILVGTHYGLIVLWEENRLKSRLGARYDRYCGTVARWLGGRKKPIQRVGSWGRGLRSERSTLMAMSACVLLVLGAGAL